MLDICIFLVVFVSGINLLTSPEVQVCPVPAPVFDRVRLGLHVAISQTSYTVSSDLYNDPVLLQRAWSIVLLNNAQKTIKKGGRALRKFNSRVLKLGMSRLGEAFSTGLPGILVLQGVMMISASATDSRSNCSGNSPTIEARRRRSLAPRTWSP